MDHPKRLTRRSLIGGLALGGITLPGSAPALPFCSEHRSVAGWSIFAHPDDFDLKNRNPAAITGRGVELIGDEKIELRVSVRARARSVTVNGRIPAKFSVENVQHGFAAVGSGRDSSTYLVREDRLLQPLMQMDIFVDSEVVLSQVVNWQDDVLKLVNGEVVFEVSSKEGAGYEGVVKKLRSGKVISAALSNRDTKVLDRTGLLVGVVAGLEGIGGAWNAGTEMSGDMKRKLERKECDDGCFLTSACCEAFGRPDDCWELETLRRFRDHVLVGTPDGGRDIEEYYRDAPHIVAALPASTWMRRLALARVYLGTVLPCALLIRLSAFKCARRLYSRCFLRCRRRYLF